jgi:hypothetical protein
MRHWFARLKIKKRNGERTFDSHVLVVQSMSRLFVMSQTNATRIYTICQTVHVFRGLQSETICTENSQPVAHMTTWQSPIDQHLWRSIGVTKKITQWKTSSFKVVTSRMLWVAGRVERSVEQKRYIDLHIYLSKHYGNRQRGWFTCRCNDDEFIKMDLTVIYF